jgi:hypothetical protein
VLRISEEIGGTFIFLNKKKDFFYKKIKKNATFAAFLRHFVRKIEFFYRNAITPSFSFLNCVSNYANYQQYIAAIWQASAF